MRISSILRSFVAFLILGSCKAAFSHSMYQSAVMLDYHARSVEAELQLPPSRLEKAIGQRITQADLAALRPDVEAYIRQRFRIHSGTDASWNVSFSRSITWETVDGAEYVVAHLLLTPPPGVSVRRLILEDSIITDTLPSSVILVSVRSDWNSSTFAGDPELLGVLNGEERSMEIDRGSGGWMRGFSSIFHLGIRHIAEGTDHLLFLLALLLPASLLYRQKSWAEFAGVRHGFVQILKVVTAFTVGHSMTLALAASGIVHVPGRPIEILIAVSILVSAVHAVRPLFPGREAFIAAGFGLIHGLAFASTLAELGLRGWERAESIFAFNLGIEAMQLLVVVCIMPSLMLLSWTSLYTPFRLIGAAFAGFASCGWIFERSSNHPIGVDTVVDGLGRHALLLALSLFVTAVLANRILSNRSPQVSRPT